MLRTLSKWILRYLAAFGFVAHLGIFGYAGFIALERDYSAGEFIIKSATWAGLDAHKLQKFLFSPPDLDGVPAFMVREQRPRLLLPQLSHIPSEQRAANWQRRVEGFAERDWRRAPPCGNGMLRSAACWLTLGDRQGAERAIAEMLRLKVEQVAANRVYGNGWELALAYDWIADYDGMTDGQRARIEAKLEEALHYYLLVLNADSASLWHGRASLASNAWLVAVSLGTGTEYRQEMFLNATHHFLGAIEALRLTEAWPEGYNYWINNRAFNLGLAAAAFVNGLRPNKQQETVRDAIRRTAMWHVYATRPDHRAEALGDEGPRVDLGEETARFIDLAATISGDPYVSIYGAYLHRHHGHRAYYRGYRWWYQLLMPESQQPSIGDLAVLAGRVPSAEIFGRNAMNQVYMRGGWGADDTFISFRAGASFTHHGHYDAGHFTLFKGAPLAMNSGTYGDFFSAHRLNYALRSVAKNTLLVMRPGEEVQPNRFFRENFADGGQRVVLPTGSAIRSVDHWRENRHDGKHLAGGEVESFEHVEGLFSFVASDLTNAYNTPSHDEGGSGGKVERLRRSLLYLPGQGRLITYDHVRTVDPTFTPKWLLHVQNTPRLKGLKLLKGEPDNGILASEAQHLVVTNDAASMKVDILLPKRSRTLLIGGKDYRYYVDRDGDATTLDGVNAVEGEKQKKWFESSDWRVEVESQEINRDHRFLNVLSLGGSESDCSTGVMDAKISHLICEDTVVVFIERDEFTQLHFRMPDHANKLWLFGLPPWRDVQVGSQSLAASREGTLLLDPGRGVRLDLSW